ncbi:MAG: hypothetical protein WD972_03645 [Candidatus Andersenbacteria bacterium]
MVRTVGFSFIAAMLVVALLTPLAAEAALIDQVNDAFTSVYGRLPTFAEWEYWAQRVQRGEKKTYAELVGAMGYQKVNPGTVLAVTTPVAASPPTTVFKIATNLYPSPINPNFLPNGTLVKSPSKAEVFYLKDGKKSWVLPSILDRWLGENHFFKHDIITTISESDLARYPQTASVNPIYIGKVLKHPNGTQFYIDDKLRKRQLSSSVRTALRFPGKNLYPTTAAHLQEFKTGTAITRTDMQPGGMVIYDGPYHGGRIWRIEEGAGGKLTKRLYLSDYLYEADGNPDESQRVSASATELARYERGPNIERYPDGWVVGIGTSIYVVQNGTLRLIGSPEIFNAMGYKQKYVLTVFSQFLKRYPHGQPIAGFKTLVASNSITKAQPGPAINVASNLIKVRPEIRTLIAQVNTIALPIYDRELTVAENRHWVDHLYNGEVDTKAELVDAMKKAKATGKLPPRTPRTSPRPKDELKSKWFPYLFYFVHQKEATEHAREYWFKRIDSDRDTIEKLGGTLQWLKDTSGLTHK